MTDILKSFSTLQCELDVAKSYLKGVDENIKRLIGRDPSESSKPVVKRNTLFLEERGRFLKNQNERKHKGTRLEMFIHENEEPIIKKRSAGVSVFNRITDRPIEAQIKQHRGMISKVIVTPKEVPSRQERLEAQSKDATSVARNKRMFGALLGTLQKFQQEETKLRTKEDKRAQLEKKIEEHEIKEKEEIKKEKQELFFNRKKKQAEIKMIELKILRMREYASWEESQKQRMNFICTNTKPSIYFLPRKLTDIHKIALESSRAEIQNLIESKQARIQEELSHIEEKGKRTFESKGGHENKEIEDTDQDHAGDEDISMGCSDKYFILDKADNMKNLEKIDEIEIFGQNNVEKDHNSIALNISQNFQNINSMSNPLKNLERISYTELDKVEIELETTNKNIFSNILEREVETNTKFVEEHKCEISS